MNTCRLTIDHHPDTDQCGDDMITHAVHVEPVNVNAPQWVVDAATRHMCADYAIEHGHYMNMPDVDPIIPVMAARGFTTVVVLAPDYWDIEAAFWSRDHSRIANKLRRLPAAYERPIEQTAVVLDLGSGTTTLTSPKLAWEAK